MQKTQIIYFDIIYILSMIYIYSHLDTKMRMESCSEDIKNKKSGENLEREYFMF